MNKILITGSTRAICSEQVLLAGAVFSTSVTASKLLITGSLRAFVMRALDKNSRARANYTREHCYQYCMQLLSARVYLQSLNRAVL